MPPSRLVVALDVPDSARAASLVELLAPLGVLFKVGYEAYYAFGPAIKNTLRARDAGYALDLKLHDIPRTVEAAVRAIVEPGVRLITVHALGGAAMLEAAVRAAEERAAEWSMPIPDIYAVTVLTSWRTKISASSDSSADPVRTRSGSPRWRAMRAARASSAACARSPT